MDELTVPSVCSAHTLPPHASGRQRRLSPGRDFSTSTGSSNSAKEADEPSHYSLSVGHPARGAVVSPAAGPSESSRAGCLCAPHGEQEAFPLAIEEQSMSSVSRSPSEARVEYPFSHTSSAALRGGVGACASVSPSEMDPIDLSAPHVGGWQAATGNSSAASREAPSQVVHSLERQYTAALQKLDVVHRMYARLDSHNDVLEASFTDLRCQIGKLRSLLAFGVYREVRQVRAVFESLQQVVPLLLQDFNVDLVRMKEDLMTALRAPGATMHGMLSNHTVPSIISHTTASLFVGSPSSIQRLQSPGEWYGAVDPYPVYTSPEYVQHMCGDVREAMERPASQESDADGVSPSLRNESAGATDGLNRCLDSHHSKEELVLLCQQLRVQLAESKNQIADLNGKLEWTRAASEERVKRLKEVHRERVKTLEKSIACLHRENGLHPGFTDTSMSAAPVATSSRSAVGSTELPLCSGANGGDVNSQLSIEKTTADDSFDGIGRDNESFLLREVLGHRTLAHNGGGSGMLGPEALEKSDGTIDNHQPPSQRLHDVDAVDGAGSGYMSSSTAQGDPKERVTDEEQEDEEEFSDDCMGLEGDDELYSSSMELGCAIGAAPPEGSPSYCDVYNLGRIPIDPLRVEKRVKRRVAHAAYGGMLSRTVGNDRRTNFHHGMPRIYSPFPRNSENRGPCALPTGTVNPLLTARSSLHRPDRYSKRSEQHLEQVARRLLKRLVDMKPQAPAPAYTSPNTRLQRRPDGKNEEKVVFITESTTGPSGLAKRRSFQCANMFQSEPSGGRYRGQFSRSMDPSLKRSVRMVRPVAQSDLTTVKQGLWAEQLLAQRGAARR